MWATRPESMHNHAVFRERYERVLRFPHSSVPQLQCRRRQGGRGGPGATRGKSCQCVAAFASSARYSGDVSTALARHVPMMQPSPRASSAHVLPRSACALGYQVNRSNKRSQERRQHFMISLFPACTYCLRTGQQSVQYLCVTRFCADAAHSICQKSQCKYRQSPYDAGVNISDGKPTRVLRSCMLCDSPSRRRVLGEPSRTTTTWKSL